MRKILSIVVVMSACGGSSPIDSDASFTADMNVPGDAGQDAGSDAGVDSGPVCECSAGPCCDGCHYRPTDYACQETVTSDCSVNATCQGQKRFATVSTARIFCSGSDTACNLPAVQEVVQTDCQKPDGFNWLTYGRCDPSGVAHCVDGPSCVATY